MSEKPAATHEVSEPQPAAADQAVQETPPSAPVRPPRREKPAGRRDRSGGGGITWPVLLIFAGVMLLLYTTGWHAVAWWRLWTLWPALLILIGVEIWLRRAAPFVRLLVALALLVVLVWAGMYVVTMSTGEGRAITCSAGESTQGSVALEMGVGRLDLGPADSAGAFASGMFQGERVVDTCSRSGDLVSLQVRQQGEGGSWWPGQWNAAWALQLNPEVPLRSLNVKVGAGDSRLDLKRLNLKNLRVETGVGRTWVTLPGPENALSTTVTIRCGVGSIEVTIPSGVEAEIRVAAGVGNVSVDQARFPWRDGVYRSAGYDDAKYGLAIDIQNGVGSITVK